MKLRVTILTENDCPLPAEIEKRVAIEMISQTVWQSIMNEIASLAKNNNNDRATVEKCEIVD